MMYISDLLITFDVLGMYMLTAHCKLFSRVPVRQLLGKSKCEYFAMRVYLLSNYRVLLLYEISAFVVVWMCFF